MSCLQETCKRLRKQTKSTQGSWIAYDAMRCRSRFAHAHSRARTQPTSRMVGRSLTLSRRYHNEKPTLHCVRVRSR